MVVNQANKKESWVLTQLSDMLIEDNDGKINMLFSHSVQSSIGDIICYQQFTKGDLPTFSLKMPQERPWLIFIWLYNWLYFKNMWSVTVERISFLAVEVDSGRIGCSAYDLRLGGFYTELQCYNFCVM